MGQGVVKRRVSCGGCFNAIQHHFEMGDHVDGLVGIHRNECVQFNPNEGVGGFSRHFSLLNQFSGEIGELAR